MARLQYGDALAVDTREEGAVEVFGSNGPVGTHSVANTNGPAVIVGRKGSFGKVVFSNRPCFCIDTAYYIDRTSTRANLRWLYYALQTCGLDTVSQDTGVPGLSRESAHEKVLLEPPASVQGAIADFLDRRTSAIDALIAKKEKLLTLHRERRTSLLRRAVTGGIVSGRDSKDSGVEWIGRVPSSWRVLPVRRIFDVLDGRRVPVEAEERAKRTGEIPYYGASGIIDHIDEYLFDEPLVLVCEDGWNLLLRTQPVARPLHGKAWVNNHAHVLRPRFGNVEYWAAALELTPFDLFVTGMRQPKLTLDALLEVPLPVPEEAEANEVSLTIAAMDAEEQRVADVVARGCDLLREYRHAIVAAAITGRIEVPGAEPREAA